MFSKREEIDLEEKKYMYYLDLRDETCKIQRFGKYFHCPYCEDQRKREYKLGELIQHASRVGNESKSASLITKAKHLGLLKYLERFGDRKNEAYHSYKGNKRVDQCKDFKIVPSPYHETSALHSRLEDGRKVNPSGSSLDEFDRLLEGSLGMQQLAKSTSSVANDHNDKFSSVKVPWMSSVPQRKANEEPVVWPWMAIVANLPVEEKNGRFVGDSGRRLKEELVIQGYNPLKVNPVWNFRGHTGYAIVEFDKTWAGFKDAIKLEKAYEGNSHGKRNWETRRAKGDKLYAWVARGEDYKARGTIGEFLRKNGDLKTISEKQAEDIKKDESLVCKLFDEVKAKDVKCEQMKKKISRAEILMRNVMKQKDDMIDNYNQDMTQMQKVANEELEYIFIQHEHSKSHLEEQKKELEMLEKNLRQREALNETETRKLNHQKEMNERAIFEQKKAGQAMLKLAEEHKRAKEQFHERIIELEAKLDQKQALQLEIERLKGAVEVMRHMNEKNDMEADQKKKLLEEELEEKEEALDDLERLNQTLIVKQREANVEVQEARKELINGLRGSRTIITVKMMGELDGRAFHAATKRKYSDSEAPLKAEELCSLWEDYLRDPSWHPFKIIVNGDNVKEIIDEEDEKLSGLRKEFGDEVYQAVITALSEMNEYNPSGRYPVSELWHSKEMRRASLEEGVEQLLKTWRQHKRKRA